MLHKIKTPLTLALALSVVSPVMSSQAFGSDPLTESRDYRRTFLLNVELNRELMSNGKIAALVAKEDAENEAKNNMLKPPAAPFGEEILKIAQAQINYRALDNHFQFCLQLEKEINQRGRYEVNPEEFLPQFRRFESKSDEANFIDRFFVLARTTSPDEDDSDQCNNLPKHSFATQITEVELQKILANRKETLEKHVQQLIPYDMTRAKEANAKMIDLLKPTLEAGLPTKSVGTYMVEGLGTIIWNK